MHYDVHILDTPILGPKVGAAKAAPTAPCAPGLLVRTMTLSVLKLKVWPLYTWRIPPVTCTATASYSTRSQISRTMARLHWVLRLGFWNERCSSDAVQMVQWLKSLQNLIMSGLDPVPRPVLPDGLITVCSMWWVHYLELYL